MVCKPPSQHLSEDGAELSPRLPHQKQPVIKRNEKKFTRTFAAGNRSWEGRDVWKEPVRTTCAKEGDEM